MLKLLRRWWPQWELIVVGDNAFAALDFLASAQQLDVTVIARLRLDARPTVVKVARAKKGSVCPPWQRA